MLYNFLVRQVKQGSFYKTFRYNIKTANKKSWQSFFVERKRWIKKFSLPLPRHIEGVPYYQAEIIPIEPDTGNAETGKSVIDTYTPFLYF